jgi:ATP-dependent DNA helicase 2 subunit 2
LLTSNAVPAKAQGKRSKKDQVKPLSGLDIDSLLGQSKRTSISPENAIPEFKQTLGTASDDRTVENAVKQMGDIVRKLVRDSFADLQYAQAAENMRVMREELIGLEMPALYNDFLKSLKKSILSGELDGDRREMWFKHIIRGHLGLITQDESEVSSVTEDEAKAVGSYHSALHARQLIICQFEK